jgi:hypothetical protein
LVKKKPLAKNQGFGLDLVPPDNFAALDPIKGERPNASVTHPDLGTGQNQDAAENTDDIPCYRVVVYQTN